MSIFVLLFVLLVCCVVIWAARTLMAAFGIGDPIATVVYVVLVVICLAWLAGQVGLIGSGPVVHLR